MEYAVNKLINLKGASLNRPDHQNKRENPLMSFKIRLCKSVCWLLALLWSSGSYAAPMLNGIAVHQELGNELFIGALYSEVLSDDPATLTNSNLPMRMELKVIAPDGIPLRRFSRLWIEGMAINNSNNLLTEQANNMVKFDGLFKGKLMPNDHVVFALNPGQGVDISLNNVLLGTISDEKFFPMLLRTWIGSVPLSSTYRENLLKVGDISADLRARYDAINFSSTRATQVAAWTKPEPEPVTVASSSSSARSSTPATPAPVIEAPIARIELPALEQPTIVEETPVASTSVPVESTPAPATSAPVEPTPAPVTPAPAPVAVAQDADEEEDDQPALTAESLLARQFYVSDILRRLSSNVRYPKISVQRGQEGSARIAVTIYRNGTIESMNWLEESRHDRLNNEAWEAVQRSAPFPPVPDSVPGRLFEFTAPITFTLQN
jgi:protein TonB